MSGALFDLAADLGEAVLGHASQPFLLDSFALLGKRLVLGRRTPAQFAVERLTTGDWLKLRIYSEKLISRLGKRAAGRTYRDLLNDASEEMVQQKDITQRNVDVYLELVVKISDVVKRYYRESVRREQSDPSTW